MPARTPDQRGESPGLADHDGPGAPGTPTLVARLRSTRLRWGNSTKRFVHLDRYVFERMALLISKRHSRPGRGHGMSSIILAGNNIGLERLAGSVEFGRT